MDDEIGEPLGRIDSEWRTRAAMTARLMNSTWRHQGDARLAAGTRLRYVQFASLYSPCFGYDWAWHLFRILDGPGTGRLMVVYTGCFEPPGDLFDQPAGSD